MPASVRFSLPLSLLVGLVGLALAPCLQASEPNLTPVPLPILRALDPPDAFTKRWVSAQVTLPDNTAWFILGESREYDGGEYLVHLTAKGPTIIGADTTVFPLAQWKNGPPPAVIRALAEQVMRREVAKAGGPVAFGRTLTAESLTWFAPEQIAALRDLGVPLPQP